MFQQSVTLDMRTAHGIIIDPEWLKRQIRRVKPGDSGAARVLVLDDFPVRRRALNFSLLRKAPARALIPDEGFEPGSDWREAGRGQVVAESGRLIVADREAVVRALAVERDKRAIDERLGALLLLDSGEYEAVVFDRKRRGEIVLRIESICGAPSVAEEGEAVALEITDELDLHAFHPSEVAAVVREYCSEAAARGLSEARIIHGKGIGELRRQTRRVLAEHPDVIDFVDAPVTRGGAGATLARLRARGR